MKQSVSLIFHLTFGLSLLILSGSCNQSGDQQKPNIIFILTDDQRWDALGYAGNTIIQTPHMDQLAGAGLYFRNAFVTTPICAASRASLFTGLYERTHDYTFGKPPLDDQYTDKLEYYGRKCDSISGSLVSERVH